MEKVVVKKVRLLHDIKITHQDNKMKLGLSNVRKNRYVLTLVHETVSQVKFILVAEGPLSLFFSRLMEEEIGPSATKIIITSDTVVWAILNFGFLRHWSFYALSQRKVRIHLLMGQEIAYVFSHKHCWVLL